MDSRAQLLRAEVQFLEDLLKREAQTVAWISDRLSHLNNQLRLGQDVQGPIRSAVPPRRGDSIASTHPLLPYPYATEPPTSGEHNRDRTKGGQEDSDGFDSGT